MHSTKLKIRKS